MPLLDGHRKFSPVSTQQGMGQGNERGTYPSYTSAKRKCGIAYTSRDAWRRNPHSSFSRNDAVSKETKGQPMKMGQSV